ncbi:CoA-binding protein [Undibacterium sp. CY7W]|uniref:CoA-binding protein n=1 Tax=Undibacterium rugosum TaxID=2762291 RepID=A0A923I610_9BURK|nr:CoA-binding protein [Undibacterium rugosum]MBC3936789.1 CoA-binding protein [Undibacterium rugosum]
MHTDTTSHDAIGACLVRSRTIAVPGFSANPERPSHQVAAYMQQQGYRIVPVNPGLAGQTLLGELVYPDLLAAAQAYTIDIVDCFRQASYMPQLAQQAIQIGARCLWMQSGITHPQAAATAQAAGLLVVMDLCLKIEHRKRFSQC